MSIRPIALCFGLAVTSGFAVTAHATYTVTVLADPGGMGNNQVFAINASGESVGLSGVNVWTGRLRRGAVVADWDRDSA